MASTIRRVRGFAHSALQNGQRQFSVFSNIPGMFRGRSFAVHDDRQEADLELEVSGFRLNKGGLCCQVHNAIALVDVQNARGQHLPDLGLPTLLHSPQSKHTSEVAQPAYTTSALQHR